MKLNLLSKVWPSFSRIGSACIAVIGYTSLGVVLSSYNPNYATAQSQSIFQQGDAVVTGFSGVTQWRYPTGADPVDYQIINQQGITLQVFSLSQMFGADDARKIPVERGFALSAGRTGQVFGVALDDGVGKDGKPGAPNIYAAATSAFGLQILKETPTEVMRTKTGGPDVRWMQGQFGDDPDSGPGSIWKIDGATGEVQLFVNVILEGVANSGPALGNIAFDPKGRSLFVSDLQTGMVHSYDLDGAETDVYDHGGAGRALNRLLPVEFDPAGRVPITDPKFDANDPATWGFAAPERRVWGLSVHDGRLFYAVAAGLEIWSVGIGEKGTLNADARLEIAVDAANNDPISDISFDAGGAIFLAQRGPAVGDYGYGQLAQPDRASLLVYTGTKRLDGTNEWKPGPGEYPVGFAGENRKTNGGLALGYGYYPDGFIKYDACESIVWSTGELLRMSDQHSARLGDPGIVTGLQGIDKKLLKPENVPPFKSYHIDYDDKYQDTMFHGHMGDVTVWSKCGAAIGDLSGPASPSSGAPSKTSVSALSQASYPKGWKPREPGKPDLRISKSCSPAAFGGSLECTVKLINVGDTAPPGRVGFTDLATPDFGPGANAPLILLRVGSVDPRWLCTALPATSLTCSLPGDALTPGKEFSVGVTVDISPVVSQPGWQVTSTATLSTNGTPASDTVGDTLVLTKSAPSTCRAGETCTFQISLTNFAFGTFDGVMKFSDDFTIGGQLASGVRVDGVWPNQGCSIPSGGALPLEWQCPITIPSYGLKTFEVDIFIPKSAAPATGSVPARNCIVVTTPGLSPALPGSGQSTSPVLGAMLSAPTPAAAPGMVCVDFEISAANPVLTPPTQVGLPKAMWPLPPGAGCKGRPQIKITDTTPASFSYPGVAIEFEYTVTNKTTCDIYGFRITESLRMNGSVRCASKVRPVSIVAGPNKQLAGDWFGVLGVNDSVACWNEYITTSGTGAISSRVGLDSRW